MRVVCNIHGQTDCSPLLNGCSQLTGWHEKPSLPYAGTSGSSGSDTSRERAKHRDESGKTLSNQQIIMRALEDAGHRGMTCAEFKKRTGMDHSPASSTFTGLHKDFKIARLAETRNGSHPYILPQYVDGRKTEYAGQIGGRVTVGVIEYEELLKCKRMVVERGNEKYLHRVR